MFNSQVIKGAKGGSGKIAKFGMIAFGF